jgi:hypothetical protein
MRSIISGDFTADSCQRVTLPVSAYGGFTMWSGTLNIGLGQSILAYYNLTINE